MRTAAASCSSASCRRAASERAKRSSGWRRSARRRRCCSKRRTASKTLAERPGPLRAATAGDALPRTDQAVRERRVRCRRPTLPAGWRPTPTGSAASSCWCCMPLPNRGVPKPPRRRPARRQDAARPAGRIAAEAGGGAGRRADRRAAQRALCARARAEGALRAVGAASRHGRVVATAARSPCTALPALPTSTIDHPIPPANTHDLSRTHHRTPGRRPLAAARAVRPDRGDRSRRRWRPSRRTASTTPTCTSSTRAAKAGASRKASSRAAASASTRASACARSPARRPRSPTPTTSPKRR